MLEFSGYSWKISHAPEGKGPGPNIFLEQNVFIDKQGRLSLRIARHGEGWSCAELRLSEALGYGRYVIEVENDPNLLDPQSVFGFFTYDFEAPPYHRELDVEFARWGDTAHPGGNHTVQPYTEKANTSHFELEALGERSMHVIEWLPAKVIFVAYRIGPTGWGRETARFEWSRGEVFLPGEAFLHLNLWLFQGEAPRNGAPQMIKIGSFDFTPLDS